MVDAAADDLRQQFFRRPWCIQVLLAWKALVYIDWFTVVDGGDD